MSLKEYFQLLVFETKVSVPVIPFMLKFLYELVKCDLMNVLVNIPGEFCEIGQVTCSYSLSAFSRYWFQIQKIEFFPSFIERSNTAQRGCEILAVGFWGCCEPHAFNVLVTGIAEIDFKIKFPLCTGNVFARY